MARQRRGIIGRDGRLPWHVPEDRAFFRAISDGRALVVGRRTYEAMSANRGARHFVVVTSRPLHDPHIDIDTAPSVHRAIQLARQFDPVPIVAGGSGIYTEALGEVTDIWWTDVQAPDLHPRPGDALIPEPNWNQFDEVTRQQLSPIAVLKHYRRRMSSVAILARAIGDARRAGGS